MVTKCVFHLFPRRMSDGGQSNVYNLVRKKKKKLIQVPEPFEDGRLSPSVTLRNASRLSRYEMMDYEGRDDDADSTHMTPRDGALSQRTTTTPVPFGPRSGDARRGYKQSVSLRHQPAPNTPKDRVSQTQITMHSL